MRRITAAVAVAVVLAVGVFLFLRSPTGVSAARAVLDDDGRFTTTRGAAEAFLETSTILQGAARSCDDPPRCDAILQAAAYAQVLSFEIAGCTQPGVYDARQAMIGYLRGVDEVADGESGPSPPPLPDC